MARVDTAVDYLLALPRFTDAGRGAYRPGLHRIRALLDALGNPHEACRICHVGGTNGKGSTASMIAAILTVAGLRAGLHTSPHLLRVNERMRVDGRPAADAWLADAVARFRPLFDRVKPSFFEATVALSLLFFAEEDVNVAVVEVGLGGRLDATNTVAPAVSVITNVSLEHTDILGTTIAEIAAEKAGIIKMGVPVVHGAEDPSAQKVIEGIAAERKSPIIRIADAQAANIEEGDATRFSLRTPRVDYGMIELDLLGHHQMMNARLAVLAAEAMLPDLRVGVVQEALRSVRDRAGLRGRLEHLGGDPPVIVDVGHNADGIATALEAVRSRMVGRKLGVVLALMRDKDVGAVASVLAQSGAAVRAVPLDSDRALAPNELVAALRRAGVDVAEAADVDAAVTDLRDADGILVVGSHLLAADAMRRCRRLT